jgi:predicted alpha/beta-hydrolase family hydrolase
MTPASSARSARDAHAPFFLFAPGAGAGIDSAWMRAWRDRLATLGPVLAFDYPYRLAGRKAPDRLPVLVAAHRDAASRAREQAGDARPLFFVGKSMGSRIGCHLAVEQPSAAVGLVCLGYPLRGQGGQLRDEVLRALRLPVLFVQGTRDPLCPLDELRALLPQLPVAHELHVVDGGNHSLEVPKPRRRSGEARADVQGESDQRVLAAITAFVEKTSAASTRR